VMTRRVMPDELGRQFRSVVLPEPVPEISTLQRTRPIICRISRLPARSRRTLG
jgi:hypothetical protein